MILTRVVREQLMAVQGEDHLGDVMATGVS